MFFPIYVNSFLLLIFNLKLLIFNQFSPSQLNTLFDLTLSDPQFYLNISTHLKNYSISNQRASQLEHHRFQLNLQYL